MSVAVLRSRSASRSSGELLLAPDEPPDELLSTSYSISACQAAGTCAIAYYDRCENSIVGVNIVSSTCPCVLRQSSSVSGLGLSNEMVAFGA